MALDVPALGDGGSAGNAKRLQYPVGSDPLPPVALIPTRESSAPLGPIELRQSPFQSSGLSPRFPHYTFVGLDPFPTVASSSNAGIQRAFAVPMAISDTLSKLRPEAKAPLL